MTDLIQAIKRRRSTRTFTGSDISATDRSAIESTVKDTSSPFGGEVSIYLRNFPDDSKRPGTYGFIHGCHDYLLLAYDDKDTNSVLTGGYKGERAILEATSLGLGSCWLGATYSADFCRALPEGDNRQLQVIIALGHARTNRSLIDRFSSLVAGSTSRKELETLFPGAASSQFAESLEAMRLAPSARNQQPWRAIIDGDTVHFFHTSRNRFAILDCGIGLCHFHIAEKACGMNGQFFRAQTVTPKELSYLISYRRK